MVIRTSFRGLLIWFGVAALLALLGLLSIQTDEACGAWGYVVKDARTCEASAGYWVARFFGLNCLLAGLSIVWALFKTRRREPSWASGTNQAFSSFGPSGEALRRGSSGVAGGSEVRPRPVGPKTRGLDESSTSATTEPRNGSGEPREKVEVSEINSRSPDAGSEDTAVQSAVTYERKETLSFRSMVSMTETEMSETLSAAVESFRIKQSTLTALFLAERMKEGGDGASFSALSVAEFFELGATLGVRLFRGKPQSSRPLESESAEVLAEYVHAARDDAQYFYEVSHEQIDRLFDSLPSVVRTWLSNSLLGDSPEALKKVARRMFVSGILFTGFQSPPPPAEPTW